MKPVAVTMGDPAGIGPEIILKSIGEDGGSRRGGILVVGDYGIMDAACANLGLRVPLHRLDTVGRLEDLPVGVPVLDVPTVDPAGERIGLVDSLERGKVSTLGGRAAVGAIERAVALALEGRVAGIATAPINKEALREAGYSYIGHTEMLSEMTGSAGGFTMFQVDRMRIFFYSRHTSLRRAIDGMTAAGVADSLVQADICLRSLGVTKPRLALAALNPHGSDGGLFGHEEEEILVPACTAARERGIDLAGPMPADSVFHLALEGRYDGVLSLYHDQGHIAAKTYDFYRTVSVTLGLPFIRTSVDHGTAFEIAWQGKANPVSMGEAVMACSDLAERYDPSLFEA